MAREEFLAKRKRVCIVSLFMGLEFVFSTYKDSVWSTKLRKNVEICKISFDKLVGDNDFFTYVESYLMSSEGEKIVGAGVVIHLSSVLFDFVKIFTKGTDIGRFCDVGTKNSKIAMTVYNGITRNGENAIFVTEG